MKRNCINTVIFFRNLNRKIKLGNNLNIRARPSGKVNVYSCVETKEAVLIYTNSKLVLFFLPPPAPRWQ